MFFKKKNCKISHKTPYNLLVLDNKEPKTILFLEKKYILVTTDSHFQNSWQEMKHFCKLLASLPAKDYHLVLLGDLFHCWTDLAKTLFSEQKKLLQYLVDFRKKGGAVHFLMGNRDIFFSKKQTLRFDFGKPFDSVSRHFLVFETKDEKKIFFEHGDLINQQDKNHLLWRKFIRSYFVKICFCLIPSCWIKKFIFYAEKKLKNQNKKHKKLFPKEAWLKFLSQKSAYQLCVVGHFHPKKTLFEKHKFKKTTIEAIILKAWMDEPVYLVIDQRLKAVVKLTG